MATAGENKLTLTHRFDRSTKRHYLNDHCVVLHCHHFASLSTQLAMDADETGELFDSSEETFYEVLVDYFKTNNISSQESRADLACQYFAMVGLGTIKIKSMTEDGGEVELPTSHVDSGWIKKWGSYGQPINFIGAGFLAAMFSAAMDKPVHTYQVDEKQSIVMGAETSIFNVATR